MDKQYYTTTQAARLLSVSADTVLKWVRQGKIASYRTPGGHARIPRGAVRGLLPAVRGGSYAKAEPTLPYHYCWEFHGQNDDVKPECRQCVVFRSRARRCYEMRDLPDEFGPLKLRCQTACENCDYFESVQQEHTSVLIVSRNRSLCRGLEADEGDGSLHLECAASEYELSGKLNSIRPDYIVIDCSFGRLRTREICRHLANDDRVPFAKIILASRDATLKDCYEGRIFGWIKKPFTFMQLRCCVGQAE